MRYNFTFRKKRITYIIDVKYFQVEEVGADLQLVKGEQCIIMRTRDAKIVLTNAVSESQFLLTILCDKI